jgi:hypothetical protein
MKTRLANKLYSRLCAGQGGRYKSETRRTATHVVFSRWGALVRQFGPKRKKCPA